MQHNHLGDQRQTDADLSAFIHRHHLSMQKVLVSALQDCRVSRQLVSLTANTDDCSFLQEMYTVMNPCLVFLQAFESKFLTICIMQWGVSSIEQRFL
jgi:hypothetical protein